MTKEFPNKEEHQPKGIVISTYWSHEEWLQLKTFMEKRGIDKDATAIKQGFFLGANVIDKLFGDLLDIKIKRKTRSDKGTSKKP